MGQYRQWLYYREVDQQLRAQRAQQLQLLQQLQDEANQLEQAFTRYDEPVTNNPLVKALLAEHQHVQAIAAIEQQARLAQEERQVTEARPAPTTTSPMEKEVAKAPVAQPLQRAADAPSLAIWGEPSVSPPTPTAQTSSPTETRARQAPQSSTIPAPVAEQPTHKEAASQFQGQGVYEIPIQTPPSIQREPGELPVDQQSERVNQLITRWAQRWHRDTPPTNVKPSGQERRLERNDRA